MTKEREAIGLRLDLSDPLGNVILPPGYAERHTGTADTHQLLELAIETYRGTIDDEDEVEWSEQIAATLSGHQGAFDVGASRVAVTAGDKIVAAALIIHVKDDRPLLANVMVHPDHSGRGIGATLIIQSARALKEAGFEEFVLIVTRGNPAEGVYRKLGFKDWPREAQDRPAEPSS